MRKFNFISNKKHGFIFVLLTVCLVITPLMTPQTALAADYPLPASNAVITNALDWMHDQQLVDGSIGGFSTSAWVVMAISAAGQNPHNWRKDNNPANPANPSIIDYLENNANTASTASDYARMMLAITTTSSTPTNFGSRDFVTLLKTTYDGTQIGSNVDIGDDAWGIMALISAGESANSEIIRDSITFLKSKQQGDGGWAYDGGTWTDVDTTASVIMAFLAAGESAGSTEITNGLTYIKNTQNNTGGFDSGWGTNASTDSWAVCAIKAAGQNPNGADWRVSGNTPVDDLLTFHDGATGGFIDWTSSPDTWTTSYTIIALLGKYYPISYTQNSSSPADNEDIVRYASIETAARTIESVSADEAVLLLENVKNERTGQILDAVNLEQRTNIILKMNRSKLEHILPEISPDKLFEIPAQQLFELLPEVPTEQLTGEIAPEINSNSLQSGITEIKNSSQNITLQTEKIETNEWVDFLGSVSPLSDFGANSPFTSLMLKPERTIENAEITINQFQAKPAGVNYPSGYPYLGLYYQINLGDISAADISASRLVFRLNKDILSFMQHNKWSVLLNRWDATTQDWMTIETKRIAEDRGFVYYSAAVPEYSVFCITGETAIPESGCSVSALSIIPQEVVSGDTINITADISNQATETRNYTATLWVNQTIEQTQKVTVPPGEAISVTFSLTKHEAGEYQVRIDRLTSTFTVNKQSDTTPPAITAFSPVESVSERRPLVNAGFTDSGDGIDNKNIELLLDYENITTQSEITEATIMYHPDCDLAPGEHFVKLTVTDKAGNSSIQEWNFTISELPSLPGYENPICDPDNDGVYEDFNGNGRFDLYDIADFNANINCESIQNNVGLFDFNYDEVVNYADVQVLLAKMYKEIALSFQ